LPPAHCSRSVPRLCCGQWSSRAIAAGPACGQIIVQELEKRAFAARIDRLILLTQTAVEFFARQGYRVIERMDVPEDVRQSQEFRSLCPTSTTCMMKVLIDSGKP
jgi:amino-acid N-acetyltransferase